MSDTWSVPLETDDAGVLVSDRVLRLMLADAVARSSDALVSRVEITVGGTSLAAVRVDLAGRYGTDLRSEAERVRAIAVRVIELVTGLPLGANAGESVTIAWTDLLADDD